MLTLVDPLLIIIAVTICVAGIMKRSRLWMMGQPGDALDCTGSRIKALLVDGILHDVGQEKFAWPFRQAKLAPFWGLGAPGSLAP